MVETLNAIAFGIFVVLAASAAATTGRRLARYRLHRIPTPTLLWRDVALTLGLAVPFAAILLARAVGLGPVLATNAIWTLITAGPAIAGMGTYVYFELRVVERSTHEDQHR